MHLKLDERAPVQHLPLGFTIEFVQPELPCGIESGEKLEFVRTEPPCGLWGWDILESAEPWCLGPSYKRIYTNWVPVETQRIIQH
jgi:hypothetical protein